MWVMTGSTKDVSGDQLHREDVLLGVLVYPGQHFFIWFVAVINRAAIIFVTGDTAIGIGIIGMTAQTKHIEFLVLKAYVCNTSCLSPVWQFGMAVGADICHQLAFIIDLVMRIVLVFVLGSVMAVVTKICPLFVGGSPMKQGIVNPAIIFVT